MASSANRQTENDGNRGRAAVPGRSFAGLFGSLGRSRGWLIALAFFLVAAWCIGSPAIPNATSRIALAYSMAVHGTKTIDEVASAEQDRALFEGHYYSDKAPGVAILMVPGVAMAHLATRPLHLGEGLLRADGRSRTGAFYAAAMGAMLLILIPLSVAGVVAFRHAALDAGIAERVADGFTVVFAFGTPYLIWSALPLGHATAAAFLLLGFAQYWALAGGRARPRIRIAAAGFFLAFAVLVEFIAAPASIAIGVLIAMQGWPARGARPVLERAALLVLGGALPALMLLAYNTSAFGSPFHLGYSSVDGWEGMKQGFFGISLPSPAKLWMITVSRYRGVLWLSPVLLPALVACLMLLRDARHRPAAIAILVVAASYFLINAGYFYWDGGYSTGPRHVTPALPFLVFGLALAWPQLPRWFRAATVATGIYSVVVVTLFAVVEKRCRDDGLPMLSGHLWPKLIAGQGDTFAAHGLPLVIVLAVPFAVLATLVWQLGLLRRAAPNP